MEVQIKAIHFDISEKLVAFVNKKIDKLSRRFDAIGGAEVNLTLVKPEAAKIRRPASNSASPVALIFSPLKPPTLSKRPSTSRSMLLSLSLRK